METQAVASRAGPVRASERVRALDAVRGIALLGVALVNVVTEFRVDLFEYYFLPRGPEPTRDRVATWVLSVFVEFKAFTVFSLLFGVGLAIQFERAEERGAGFGAFAARRLGALLAMGLAHMVLVWNGDILTEYAVIGALVAVVIRAQPAAMLGLASLLFLVQCAPVHWPLPWFSSGELERHVADAQRAYGTGGTYATALAFRVREIRYIATLLANVLPRTAGVFLLGAAGWRSGLVRTMTASRAAVISIGALALGAVATIESRVGSAPPGYGPLAELLATLGLALGYAAGIFALATARPAWLCPFEPVGRMALTNYLTQSVVFGAVFYGYGLGLFHRVGVLAGAGIAVGVYLAQMAFSAIWLRYFRFGPLEWAWRWVSYGRAPALRIHA